MLMPYMATSHRFLYIEQLLCKNFTAHHISKLQSVSLLVLRSILDQNIKKKSKKHQNLLCGLGNAVYWQAFLTCHHPVTVFHPLIIPICPKI